MKFPLILSDFNVTWTFSTNVREMHKDNISWKSVQWEPNRSMWMDRQTMTKVVLRTRLKMACDKKAPHKQSCYWFPNGWAEDGRKAMRNIHKCLRNACWNGSVGTSTTGRWEIRVTSSERQPGWMNHAAAVRIRAWLPTSCSVAMKLWQPHSFRALWCVVQLRCLWSVEGTTKVVLYQTRQGFYQKV